MAGRGSDGCGVGVRHSFAELGRVASEECPTRITELGVKRATSALVLVVWIGIPMWTTSLEVLILDDLRCEI